MTPQDAEQLGLARGIQGLLVQEVDPNAPGAKAGIQPGDVIVEANRQSVRTAADLQAALSRNSGRPSVLLLNRRGQTAYVTVRTDR